MTASQYAVHMVNNGADCEAVISGIPAEVKELKVYVTNTKDCMKETAVTVSYTHLKPVHEWNKY